MWIARDSNGSLYIYTDKPKKLLEGGYWYPSKGRYWFSFKGDCYSILSDLWPEISWEDEEPRELVLKPIKKE